MPSLHESMMSLMASGDNLSAISKSVSGNPDAVKSALGMGLPMILGSMSNTASTPAGAQKLASMLGQSGGTIPLDNVSGYLGSTAAAGGSGMLNSLLGSQLTPIQNAISQKTGLPPAVVGQVLAIAAPLVISHVGKMVTGQKVKSAGLASFLGEHSKAALQSSPEAAALGKQYLGTQQESGGLGGFLKKLLKR